MAHKTQKKKTGSNCALCSIELRQRICINPEGRPSTNCPTVSAKNTVEKARKEYQRPENYEFARNASIQEGECYADRDRKPYTMHPVKPRILEIAEFAKKMGYRRLGLAFCAGLAREAEKVANFYEKKGFEIVSIICKAGCIPKEEIGIKDEEKIFRGEHESMCNPIFQAMMANEAYVDFNILLGLCVGHDSLFLKYAKAPSTVLAVKDRVTGHNPLAALYLLDGYYAWLK